MLARGNEDFCAPGKHSFSLFQEENIPWSTCVLLTSPLINISLLNTRRCHTRN